MMIVSGSSTMKVFAGFLYLLKEELKHPDYKDVKKVLLLQDGASIHMGSDVVRFLGENPTWKVIYYPQYCCEQNAQELVWHEIKNSLRKDINSEDILQYKIIEKINGLSSDFINKCWRHTLHFQKKSFLLENF